MFDAQLELAISSAKELSHKAAILIVDLDKLKALNDSYGHQYGDEALRALAVKLKLTTGPDCLVARIGGDEFGVVFASSSNAEDAARFVAEFPSEVTCDVETPVGSVLVSASAGAALFPDDGVTASELLATADKAMYTRKHAEEDE
jgi:diguanylate cyclase (GGDEF)-like protein